MCSWRPDSKFCFPGDCGTSCEPRECQCATNFTNPGNNCMDCKYMKPGCIVAV